MTSKLRFGEFLIQRGIVSADDVLQALDHQSGQRKPFHRAAVDLGYLDVKDAYGIYNYRAGTDLTFEAAAVQLGRLTAEQVVQINASIDADRRPIGEILVAMNVATSRTIVSALREFKLLLAQREGCLTQVMGISLFEGLDDEALQTLCGLAQPSTCRRDQRIFSQGEPADRLCAVVRGIVTLRAADAEDEDAPAQTTEVYGGDTFGETVLLPGSSWRAATAEASDGCELLSFGRDPLRGFLAGHPPAAAQILGRVLIKVTGRLGDAGLSLGSLGLA